MNNLNRRQFLKRTGTVAALGAVYGGASVLGVPFALALLGRNQVVVLSALSLIGAMGSYVPPVAFTPVVTSGLTPLL